jgi:aryl-alcohol dehydrogenase-like predicted oxidoreductase
MAAFRRMSGPPLWAATTQETTMEKRQLGQSSLHVYPITFGGNVFGWTADEAMSFKLLDAFVAAGFNFIDTADVYSRWHPGNKGGESETIIGNWLKARGNRDKVIIASKLGIEMAPEKKGLSRKYMMQAVEDSLRRLKTDYIDLYQSHRDDPETPIEETLSAYADLIKQGKVREIGASNFSAARLAESLKISTEKSLPRYQSLQPQYSLVERAEFEGPLEDLCLKEKIGVIGYYSIASGFLTGKYRSKADAEGRARGPRVDKYLNDYGFGVIAALDDVAKRYNAKPVQVAMAWLIARPSVTAPIASATTLDQLAELLKSAELTLDAAAIAQIDAASKPR